MLVVLVKQWKRYMLKALVTGGSTGIGSVLVNKLSKTYEVEVVPREVLSSLEVGYNARKGDYDLVFFNHHYMPEEFDHKSYEMNCLVCLHILNSINLNLSLLNSNSHYYNSAIKLKNEKIIIHV